MRNPLVGPGHYGDPWSDPGAALWPESKWMPQRSAAQWPVLARRTPAAAIPNPANDVGRWPADRIQWMDRFGRAVISGAQIDSTWRAWELTRLSVPMGCAAILEKLPTSIDEVWALDDDGADLYSYGPQNSLATRTGLRHPDPTVGPLEWQFAVTTTSEGWAEGQIARLSGSPFLPGSHLCEPWADLRNGSAADYAGQQQIVCPSGSLVRIWALFRAPTNRFRVQVGARISGYWQAAGKSGPAHLAVVNRS